MPGVFPINVSFPIKDNDIFLWMDENYRQLGFRSRGALMYHILKFGFLNGAIPAERIPADIQEKINAMGTIS